MTSQHTEQPTLFHTPMTTELKYVETASIEPPETNGTIPAIGKFGIIQTVLLRASTNPMYEYQVIAGSRRVNTAIKNNILTVPAIITTGTDDQFAAARAIENSARRDNPVQEAIAWKQVLDSGVYADERALAADLRVPLRLVKKRLKLAKLPRRILEGINDGTLTERTAEKMSTLDANYLSLAYAAFDASVANDQPFTHGDLRAVQVKKTEQTKSAALGALSRLPVTQALITLDPVTVMAEQVRQMCNARNINPVDLARVLAGKALVTASTDPAQDALPAGLQVSLPGPANTSVKTSATKPTQAATPSVAAVIDPEDAIPFDTLGNDFDLSDVENDLPFALEKPGPVTTPIAAAHSTPERDDAFPLANAAATDDTFPFSGLGDPEPTEQHATPAVLQLTGVQTSDLLTGYEGEPAGEDLAWDFEGASTQPTLEAALPDSGPVLATPVAPMDGVAPIPQHLAATEEEDDLTMPWDLVPTPTPASAPRTPIHTFAADQGGLRASTPGTRAPRAPRAGGDFR